MHERRLNTICGKMQTTPNDGITDSIMELFADDECSEHVACAFNESCMNKAQKITLENIDLLVIEIRDNLDYYINWMIETESVVENYDS